MIELKAEDYCQDCKSFSPISETMEYGDRVHYDGTIELAHVRTIIRCENTKRCAGIARHIRNEINKEIMTIKEN